MTIIVGIVDTNGDIYIGGDSAGTAADGSQSVFANKKVFTPVHGPWYLIGICGSFRMAQVLKYNLVPPLPPGPGTDLEHFMASEFIDAVRECYKQSGILSHSDDGTEVGASGEFIIGYQGRLFKVEDNFQAMQERRNYIAAGGAEPIAQGAMFATDGQEPTQRIMTALKASASFNAWVREPFEIVHLPYAHDWHEQYREKQKPKRKKSIPKKARKTRVGKGK